MGWRSDHRQHDTAELPVSVQLALRAEERRMAYIATHPRSLELSGGPRLSTVTSSPASRSDPTSFRPTDLGMARLRLAFAYSISCHAGDASTTLELRDSDVILKIGETLLDRMPLLVPLCFGRAGRGYDVSAAGGALVASVAETDCRLALCTGSLLPGSRSAAAFTVVRKGSWACYIGVASRAADVERPESFNGPHFCGLGSASGKLCHGGQRIGWEGAEGFTVGDRIEMMLDGRQGALHVAKNGRVLGQAQGRLQLITLADPASLCWAVSASDSGWAVRVERLEPRAFGASDAALHAGGARQLRLWDSDDDDNIC